MPIPHSFVELIADRARQKIAAAKAKKNPNTTAEKPREAIFDALNMVRDAIAGDGFVFVPSRPKFVRKSGDFSFEISVQSDRYNVAGQRAAIWVHTAVYSKSLTAWRKMHSSDWIRPRDPVPLPMYANQLGYLCDPSGWMEWDFADKFKRRTVADDLIGCIRTGAYPLFAIFEGPIDGIAAITERDWPPPEGILSYLLARGHSRLANEKLRRYLDGRPTFRRQFESHHQKFSEQGLPAYRSALAHDLAAFCVATGHPWETTAAPA